MEELGVFLELKGGRCDCSRESRWVIRLDGHCRTRQGVWKPVNN